MWLQRLRRVRNLLRVLHGLHAGYDSTIEHASGRGAGGEWGALRILRRSSAQAAGPAIRCAL